MVTLSATPGRSSPAQHGIALASVQGEMDRKMLRQRRSDRLVCSRDRSDCAVVEWDHAGICSGTLSTESKIPSSSTAPVRRVRGNLRQWGRKLCGTARYRRGRIRVDDEFGTGPAAVQVLSISLSPLAGPSGCVARSRGEDHLACLDDPVTFVDETNTYTLHLAMGNRRDGCGCGCGKGKMLVAPLL
jgi:hypothetical protein